MDSPCGIAVGRAWAAGLLAPNRLMEFARDDRLLTWSTDLPGLSTHLEVSYSHASLQRTELGVDYSSVHASMRASVRPPPQGSLEATVLRHTVRSVQK